jgi:hypothetical protein
MVLTISILFSMNDWANYIMRPAPGIKMMKTGMLIHFTRSDDDFIFPDNEIRLGIGGDLEKAQN